MTPPYFHRTLRDIPGFLSAEFDALVAARQAVIKGDVKYYTLVGGERNFFHDENRKQQFYLGREWLICCKERLDELERMANHDIREAGG